MKFLEAPGSSSGPGCSNMGVRMILTRTIYCYSARPCDDVSSLHIHLDIAHNSSSYSLIKIIIFTIVNACN